MYLDLSTLYFLNYVRSIMGISLCAFPSNTLLVTDITPSGSSLL